ncbi:MAG: choice-of-anchor L domain-containing protein [Flavobacterium sp.]
MKRILLLFTFLAGVNSFSQPITVNTTTYTVPQLVNNVLFAPSSVGSASCVGTISNITWITGTNFGSTNGIGYFTNTNPNFPLSSGVILSTGNVNSARGPNTTTQSNGSFAWPGDLELFDYMYGLGIVDDTNEYNNATILEFDFVPLTTQMSFDFLFASEEYGTFQCDYSDAFAFFLTNTTTGDPATNLAVVPNTSIPISVTTIRDNSELPDCDEENVAYFGSNNQGANAAASATNFNGQTTVMTATSAVIPNNTYHIKLVISDLDDNSWDSAVFLGGGSFNIGSPEIAGTGPEFAGMTSFDGGNAVCGSKVIVAQAGASQIAGATYQWTLGPNPVGTNSYTYTITQPGTYGVTITYPGGCQQTDTMVVEYLPQLNLGTPNNLTQCSAPFDLTSNTPIIRNGVSSPVTYHHSLLDAQQQQGRILTATTYNGTDGEIIYASIEDPNTGCINTTQFTLHINPSLCIVPPVPGTPPDMYQYETALNGGTSVFNFTPQTPIVYGSNPFTDYTVTYYPTLADANAGTNAITNFASYTNTSNPQRIFAVLSENALPTNFAITSFQLFVVALPHVTISGPSAVCTGNTATITFTGTPNATVNYTFNGNPQQIILNASGTNTVVSPALIMQAVYNLVSVTITTPAGTTTQPESGSHTVNVTYAPPITTPTNYEVCDENRQ